MEVGLIQKSLDNLLNADFEVTKRYPAWDKQIAELEAILNQKLPKDLEAFYRTCNGLETSEELFQILSVDSLFDWKELGQSEFYFAENLIYSDFWTIKLDGQGGYSILANAMKTEGQYVLSHSICEFLDHLAKGGLNGDGGLYDWMKIVEG